MTITGSIDFVGTIGQSTPCNMFPIVGGDGKYYVAPTIISAPFGIPTTLGCANTNLTTITLTEAQWRTDLASLSMGTSGTYNYSAVVPAVGTPFFFVVGGGTVATANVDQNVGVRYKIDNTGTVVVDGGFANVRSPSGGLLFSGGSVGTTFSAQVIDGVLYATQFLYNPGSWLRNYFVKYDLTGTDANLTPGSWETRVTHITAWDDAFFTSSTSRQYYNRCSLLNLSGLIKLIAYVGVAEVAAAGGGGSTTIAALSGPSVLTCIIDPVGHSCTSSVNESATYGVPFADAGKNFAGATGTSRDDYTSFTVTGNGTEIIAARDYSDSKRKIGRRRFLYRDGGILPVDYEIASIYNSSIDASSDVEFSMGFRTPTGANVFYTARDTRHFYFAEEALAPPFTASPRPSVRWY